ncbi:MAG: helix-turn-helix domain-containing protein [Eubacteriales bacterium]|nr:helix-turn-helix domain-containing protein [Eubacteriales bacterium]
MKEKHRQTPMSNDISRFVSCSSAPQKDTLYAKGGKLMNPKEIGAFLKQLRNEKGITQEQLAEILGVSGRTVSRWETGTNLPDLSILVQISEYYDVEIKEILNGERKNENMDSELKETLLKVADYDELKKRQAAKAGNLSFCIMFLVCAVMISAQILMTGNLSLIIGETVILFAGGLVYIFCAVKHGAWDGAIGKNTPKKDLIVSLICAGIFSIIFFLILSGNIALSHAIGISACFFIALSIVSYVLLRGIFHLSRKNFDKNLSEGK